VAVIDTEITGFVPRFGGRATAAPRRAARYTVQRSGVMPWHHTNGIVPSSNSLASSGAPTNMPIKPGTTCSRAIALYAR
jgi:hypothetical protein